MELCEYGDAEVFIKAQEGSILPTVEAQGFLFQMAFALYAGRAELSLRHFDVKLLNFFVSDASRLVACRGEGEKGGVTLRYGVGADVVELCLPRDRAYLVREWRLCFLGVGMFCFCYCCWFWWCFCFCCCWWWCCC